MKKMICMVFLGGFTEFRQKIASKRELTFRSKFYCSAFAEIFFRSVEHNKVLQIIKRKVTKKRDCNICLNSD